MTNDHSLDMHSFFFLVVVVLVHLQWDGDKVGITQPKAPEVGAGMGREEWRRGKVSLGNHIRVSGQRL